MKDPQPERDYRKKVRQEDRSPDQGLIALGPAAEWPWNAWSFGFRWFEVWMRGWESILDAAQPGHARLDSPDGREEERRWVPASPWMPRIEASVIPLRRRTDPPASKATRISMRVVVPSLPWSGTAGNVLTLNTLVARRDPDTAAADAAKAPPKSARKSEG